MTPAERRDRMHAGLSREQQAEYGAEAETIPAEVAARFSVIHDFAAAAELAERTPTGVLMPTEVVLNMAGSLPAAIAVLQRWGYRSLWTRYATAAAGEAFRSVRELVSDESSPAYMAAVEALSRRAKRPRDG